MNSMQFNFNIEDVELARLTRDDFSNLANFDCDDSEMNTFFREEVFYEQEIGMNTTFLLYYKGNIAAACSICCDGITLSPTEKEDEGVPYLKVPAIKIARLGRDKKYRNLGLGKFLVQLVKQLAFELNDNSVGVRYLTLDAYPKRVEYYQQELGFVVNERRVGKNRPVSMRADIFKV
ncbi:MAG: GNAT family N-acetyltransferase [Peptococcaceae bacterium]|nr:GNAT family N-acetyltransferase [Peptococcaceae bacterium]